MRSRRIQEPGKCPGPDNALIKQGHKETCECQACVVPAGTVVRVIPRAGLDNGPEWLKERESTWLRQHWESHSQKRFIFCTLHCLMRITEAMFQGITQRCLKKPPVIDQLNKGLKEAGITKQFTDSVAQTGERFYEKLTFEGHEALKLMARRQDGKMAVVHMLEQMWPSRGDVDDEGGRRFVKRQAELWEQWWTVVELMSERDPARVKANRNGFERFGKECREFCFRYQAMYHEQH